VVCVYSCKHNKKILVKIKRAVVLPWKETHFVCRLPEYMEYIAMIPLLQSGLICSSTFWGHYFKAFVKSCYKKNWNVLVNQNHYACETLCLGLLEVFSKVCEDRRNTSREALC